MLLGASRAIDQQLVTDTITTGRARCAVVSSTVASPGWQTEGYLGSTVRTVHSSGPSIRSSLHATIGTGSLDVGGDQVQAGHSALKSHQSQRRCLFVGQSPEATDAFTCDQIRLISTRVSSRSF